MTAMLKTTIGNRTYVWNPKHKELESRVKSKTGDIVMEWVHPGIKTLHDAEQCIIRLTSYDGIIVWLDVE